MAITHIKDGQGFFDGGHAATHRDFGFTGSAAEVPRQSFAKGGAVAKAKPPFAAQSPAGGIEAMHDESEVAHRVRKANGGTVTLDGGDDGGMYGSMERDPVTGKLRPVTGTSARVPGKNNADRQTPAGPTARDGAVADKYAGGGRARLPTGMKATAMQRHSPINTPPRNPTKTVTPRNIMPGGAMAYGVQPSAEPAQAGSEQGIPQLKDGGKVRMGADRSSY